MLTKLPYGLAAFPLVGGGLVDIFSGSYDNVYFVDADKGNDGNDGRSPDTAKKTLQSAVTLAAAQNAIYKCGSTIYVKGKYMAAGATDPESYTENVIIPAAGGSNMTIIGVSANGTQGGLPQFKASTTTSAILTVRAPGVSIFGLGVNGAGATGGGILLDDDGSTKTAFGVTIAGCHFKNCKGSAAAATGGAIMWAATGGGWQVQIKGNKFFDNRAGIVLKGTTAARPKDVVIDKNYFFSSANTTVDADIYLGGGDGVNGLLIDDNVFATVDVPGYATSPTAARYLDLTGCTNGILSNNVFGCVTDAAGTEYTFGAAGTAAKIPTTVRMARNWGELSSASAGATGEIYRT